MQPDYDTGICQGYFGGHYGEGSISTPEEQEIFGPSLAENMSKALARFTTKSD